MAIPKGCPEFEILPPSVRPGIVVRAEEFGLSEKSKSNGGAIRRAIVEAKRIGATKVVLAPGRYLCHDDHGILIDGLEDFVFDGAGAELVFYRPAKRMEDGWEGDVDPERPSSSFLIKDCRRIRFGNLKVDWDWSVDPLGTCCRVADAHVDAAENASYVDLEIVGNGPHPMYGKTLPIQSYTPMREDFDGFADDFPSRVLVTYEGNTGSKSEWLGPNKLRLWPSVLPTAPDAFVADYARRRYSAKKNREMTCSFAKRLGRAVRLVHHYYGKNAFHMDSCEHLTMQGIRIYSTFGMGFVVSGRQHHWQLVDCVIAPPEGSLRPVTVTADSIHVVNSLGWAKLIRFATRLNQDDLFNFHDCVSSACRAGERRLSFTHRRANPYFGAKAGDSIELRQFNYEPTGLRVKVVRATDTELEIDRDIPEAKYGSYILFNDSFATDHIIVRDCRFDGSLGRGIFAGSNITVDGCRFRDLMRIPFKFAVGYMKKEWAEGHGTTNVLVRGCTFENCQRTMADGFGDKNRNPSEAFIGRNLRIGYGEGELDVPEWRGIVKGVLFEENTYISPRVPLFHAFCASDILFRNNRIFLGPPPARCDEHRGQLLVERSENVHAYGNRFLCSPEYTNVVVDCQRLDPKIEPVPRIDPFSYEVWDGLLLRNGKPHYWIADGSDLGGCQSSPVGLWLAKLQGTTWASVLHSSCQVHATSEDGHVRIAPRINEAGFSWLREAIRLGFLTQSPEGFFPFENGDTLAPVLVRNPELMECLYDHGHHMGADPGSELGRAVLNAKRYPLFAYGEKTRYFLPELNREPGADPYNRRVREGFRQWAARKYGTIETANDVWKTGYSSWDDVVLRHTVEAGVDASCLTNVGFRANRPSVLAKRGLRTSLRAEERMKSPELYWDWMLFVQSDTTAALEREFAEARRYAPLSLMGTDVRGHQSNRDNYTSYDPLAVDRLSDVFYVHSSGFRCYDYGNRELDYNTLRDAICWPLFTARYFRCNTTRPILNSEDIIQKTVASGLSPEAMAANDLAGFDNAKFTWGELKDGAVTFTCTFSLPPRYESDRQDGSRRFYLAGISPGAVRWFSVNGKNVGYVKSPGQFYKFDVTELVRFGGENKLVGGFRGLRNLPQRPGCRILPGDMFGEQKPYGEKQYRSQYWSYLMGGHSGVVVWHWQNHDRLRLFQAAMGKRLQVAAEIALPDLRFRREKVAFLYSYMGGAGLPAMTEGLHHEIMNWAGALEFSGHRYDVLGEESFCRHAEKYPLIVAPDIWYCTKATVEAAEAYVRKGGTLVITPGSLGKTFDRYADSGFAAFAAGHTGSGRVITVEKGLAMPRLAQLLDPMAPRPEFSLRVAAEGGASEEFPCIERVLAGDDRRKILYLQNWGGRAYRVKVDLPDPVRQWTLTSLEGLWDAQDAAVTLEGSQGVAACVLTAPGEALPDFSLSPMESARLERIRDLMQFGRAAPGRKRVLFGLDSHPGHVTYSGAELYPHLIEAVRACGAEADALPPSEWTSELLGKYDAIVITESHYGLWQDFLKSPQTRQMLRDYVRQGGALFADILSMRTPGCNASFFWYNAELCPAHLAKRGIARDDRSYGMGDPRQIVSTNLKRHAITEGVRRVQLFALTPLEYARAGRLETVLALPKTSNYPDAPVLSVCEVEKGRLAVCVDPMAFQPHRIGEADNAVLLLNLMGWLLGKPITDEARAAFCRLVRDF